jgi:hypothetical protein
MMTAYSLRILLVEESEPLLIELPGFDRDRAEAFTADLRHEVEEAVAIDAPFVQVQIEGAEDVTLDPQRIAELDLEEDSDV